MTKKCNHCRWKRRCGLTLAELLIASTIMLMIATAVATLASAVHSTNDYCKGYTVSAQHARVALSRIESALLNAYANEQFPGFLIVSEQAGGQLLPETLVVWSPNGVAANPAGLPLVSEIVVFSPNPAHPNRLLEIRMPNVSSSVPARTDSSNWRTLIEQFRTSNATSLVMLTDRLRTTPITGEYRDSQSPSDLRGLVRFRQLMTPSDEHWTEYRNGLRTWHNIDWPLDSFRLTSGTRAVACQTELQIVPGNMRSAAVTAIPFYGSTQITYELQR